MFEAKTTQELMQIASAGGGFMIGAAPRSTADLRMIASAASNGGATVFFKGMVARPTLELVQIASAGNGRVIFADD